MESVARLASPAWERPNRDLPVLTGTPRFVDNDGEKLPVKNRPHHVGLFFQKLRH